VEECVGDAPGAVVNMRREVIVQAAGTHLPMRRSGDKRRNRGLKGALAAVPSPEYCADYTGL